MHRLIPFELHSSNGIQEQMHDIHYTPFDTGPCEQDETAVNPRPDNTPPIGRVPPEVLMRIFSIAAKMESSELSTSQIQRAMCISHVCSRWRAIALGLPTLWRKFTGASDGPRLISWALSHTKEASLMVELKFMRSQSQAATMKRFWAMFSPELIRRITDIRIIMASNAR